MTLLTGQAKTGLSKCDRGEGAVHVQQCRACPLLHSTRPNSMQPIAQLRASIRKFSLEHTVVASAVDFETLWAPHAGV